MTAPRHEEIPPARVKSGDVLAVHTRGMLARAEVVQILSPGRVNARIVVPDGTDAPDLPEGSIMTFEFGPFDGAVRWHLSRGQVAPLPE
jgi:hypothetical protein